ncbi:MAG: SAM-dependent methyltransferase [Streptosporangiaceae bacterium]
MYDYYLGGKDNFAADREAAERVLALVPGLRRATVENRRFLRRVVRSASEAGISQFLDIGVGLPTQGAVHEVAHETDPNARVVYADYDPVVVTHGKALLAVKDRSIMVQADLRRPGELFAMPAVREHLDLGQPVAISLFAILHFLPDSDDPVGIMAALRDAVAPGSYLAVSHIGTEFFPDKQKLAEAVAIYEKASERIWPRSRDEILPFFGDFELLEPGLVAKHQWRPAGPVSVDTPNIQWGGVARKP